MPHSGLQSNQIKLDTNFNTTQRTEIWHGHPLDQPDQDNLISLIYLALPN